MENDADPAGLRVQVCHAGAQGVWLRELTVPVGATAAQALQASGFAQDFPGVDPWRLGVGIFGRACAPETVLAEGDRVEIYRALTFDPKESRRRRVEHRRARAAAQGRERPPGLL
ncbi:RnfH family protein [Bordetella genomosp. 13]|uniref:UPF0125 protein CAL15_07575 n=1 Tax=Bordetella genomosp. 13 TaxID=463040 RepID=A0A1W6ZA56_9BORD|nr:RnfH family protein [Bordetella genomosp. 13]ARP94251.1 RnfH family protein [Bordetella genomosp. 13]